MAQPDPTIATQALAAAPLGVLIMQERRILWVNDALTKMLGLTAAELVGRKEQEISPAHREHVFEPEGTMLWELENGDGKLWVQGWRQKLAVPGQVVAHYYLDVTHVQALEAERDRMTEELATLNTRDPVTGLPNRRALLQSLDPLVSRSRRYHNPLTLMRVAVQGPAADDQMLAIGQTLRDQMRWADLLGRYERNEFLLVLPETTEEAALKLLEKLNQALRRRAVAAQSGEPLTYLWGLASWAAGDDPAKLLRRAEPLQALPPEAV